MARQKADINEQFEQYETFNWPLYGMLIRARRIQLGYRKAEHFADSIYRRTRYAISRDSLYKIEQGRQVPDSMQFLAINLALYGELLPEELTRLCTGRNWADIAAHEYPYVPYEWAAENWADYQQCPDDDDVAENGRSSSRPTDIAAYTHDKPYLFKETPF